MNREKKKAGRRNTSVAIEGNRIKEILKDKGINIKQLSESVGYARSGVSTSINSNKMDADMLDAIGKYLDVAPCFISHTETVWFPVYDCDLGQLLMSLNNEQIKDFSEIAEDHYLGESDDPNVPIKYSYKAFPYSYEKINDLDETDLLKSLLSRWDIKNSMNDEDFDMLLSLLKNTLLPDAIYAVKRKKTKQLRAAVTKALYGQK